MVTNSTLFWNPDRCTYTLAVHPHVMDNFLQFLQPVGEELNIINYFLRVAHVVNNSYLFWNSDRFCFLEEPEKIMKMPLKLCACTPVDWPAGEGAEHLNPSTGVSPLLNRMQVQLCMVNNSTLFWNPARCTYTLAVHPHVVDNFSAIPPACGPGEWAIQDNFFSEGAWLVTPLRFGILICCTLLLTCPRMHRQSVDNFLQYLQLVG